MKIVFASSEMRPFAKTGGLADAVEGLSRALHRAGCEVKVFLPLYRETREKFKDLKKSCDLIVVPVGMNQEHGRVLVTTHGGIEVYLIEQPYYFEREGLYGNAFGDYEDNDRRFIFFARGVLEALRKMRISPDILHSHDWHTGLIPVYLKKLYPNDPLFQGTRTVFTIHNIAYQGNFPPESFPLTNLSWDEYRFDRLEFHNYVNFLKGGIVYSDFLTTVSSEHAREIQREPFGCGLSEAIRARGTRFAGIVNGIDTAEWDPANDPQVKTPFSAKDPEGKSAAKRSLQREFRLPEEPEIPLFGFIGRLSEQKGIDLILDGIEGLAKLKAQFIFLGTGGAYYEAELKRRCPAAKGNLRARLAFDSALARRIYAGSDIFLMPSLYEPCGIGPMIAMRYGTVPLVHATGGLRETVSDFNAGTGRGTGIVVTEYAVRALLEGICRAIQLFGQKKEWRKLRANAMKMDFSLCKQAKKYISVYNALRVKK